MWLVRQGEGRRGRGHGRAWFGGSQMPAIRSNGALWQSGEHRVPAPIPAQRGEAAGSRRSRSLRSIASSSLEGADGRARAPLGRGRGGSAGHTLTPHFLCNSLQVVSTLLHRDPRAADAWSSRQQPAAHGAARAAASEVPLARELVLLERYVEVMRFRFGTDLRLITDVLPETRDALVPQLLLQPLVENAILHGFDDRAGEIRVTGERHGEMLRCTVCDDGRGSGPDRSSKRIGPAHTRAAARDVGDRCRFELSENQAGGVTALSRCLIGSGRGMEVAP